MAYHPKILIVDDNDVMRALLRGILRNEDYLVVGEARNGMQALEMAERLTPDVVCLDVIMPELDGLEALKTLKRDYPAMGVVMITGNASMENVQEALELGADGFVVKPFNAARVLEALARVSSSKRGAATVAPSATTPAAASPSPSVQ
jgi:two-component system chemotaxis response regulator CheY